MQEQAITIEVHQFLEQYPHLKDMLSEIEQAIRTHFGAYNNLHFEIFHDMELVSEPQLVIYIMTDYAPKTAVERLEQFDRIWWIKNATRANNQIVIDIGYE